MQSFKLKFLGVTILQGVEFPIFYALPMIIVVVVVVVVIFTASLLSL